MAIMECRTSFALDESTITRLKKLAALWKVSQAEVVRRAIEKAEAETIAATEEPLRRLLEYQASGNVAAEKADAYLETVGGDRADWGRAP